MAAATLRRGARRNELSSLQIVFIAMVLMSLGYMLGEGLKRSRATQETALGGSGRGTGTAAPPRPPLLQSSFARTTSPPVPATEPADTNEAPRSGAAVAPLPPPPEAAPTVAGSLGGAAAHAATTTTTTTTATDDSARRRHFEAAANIDARLSKGGRGKRPGEGGRGSVSSGGSSGSNGGGSGGTGPKRRRSKDAFKLVKEDRARTPESKAAAAVAATAEGGERPRRGNSERTSAQKRGGGSGGSHGGSGGDRTDARAGQVNFAATGKERIAGEAPAMLRCFGQAAAYAGSWVARAETFLATKFPNTKAMEYHDFNMFTAGGKCVTSTHRTLTPRSRISSARTCSRHRPSHRAQVVPPLHVLRRAHVGLRARG